MSERVKNVGIGHLAPVFAELIKEGKAVKFTVVGDSMYPMLRTKTDCVLLEKAEKLKKYDIPFYKRGNGEYILHRIVKVDGGVFSCAGDNETKIENPVYSHQVIGKVSGFYRNGKFISCKNILYRLYTFLWINFKFVRPVIFLIIKLRRKKK